MDQKFRTNDQLSDGFSDKLTPLEPIDLRKADTISELVRQMGLSAFGGRSLAEATDVICEMANDDDCFVVGTFSGAMTVAKMGLIICDMMEFGLLDSIVTTGALLCHGLVESLGKTHFKLEHDFDDYQLFEKGYCRIHDSLELEKNLDDLEGFLDNILCDHDHESLLSSEILCRKIGEHLHRNVSSRSILASAFGCDVPVFIPAFIDCELALDVALHNRKRLLMGKPRVRFDPFLDLESYLNLVMNAKRLGIITIGGGVPRNWGQQVGPFADALERQDPGTVQKPIHFHYGVRICPEPAYWGGLSGCTYSEGVSWGKFKPRQMGGRFAEVMSDATIAWPIIMRAVFERLGHV